MIGSGPPARLTAPGFLRGFRRPRRGFPSGVGCPSRHPPRRRARKAPATVLASRDTGSHGFPDVRGPVQETSTRGFLRMPPRVFRPGQETPQETREGR